MLTIQDYYIKLLKKHEIIAPSPSKALVKKFIKALDNAHCLADLNHISIPEIENLGQQEFLQKHYHNFKREVQRRERYDLKKTYDCVTTYQTSNLHIHSFLKLMEAIIAEPLHLIHLSASQLWGEIEKIEFKHLLDYMEALPILLPSYLHKGTIDALQLNQTEFKHCKILLWSNNNQPQNCEEKMHLNIILQALIKIYYDIEQEKHSFSYTIRSYFNKSR